MDDFDRAFDGSGLSNRAVRAFVRHWARHTGAQVIEIVSAADDARLLREALQAEEIYEVAGGRYYARSHPKDTARSEERTFVATSNRDDRGVFNNWAPSVQLRPKVEALMAGASRGKTMYVIPYLMAVPGSPLAKWAAGVELTDSRLVALHMIRMARVGPEYLEGLQDAAHFVRGVHVTGDIERLEQGTPEDKRHFVTVADERLLLHFGSSYGGNALLGKIAHGLRQASYDGHTSGQFLAEQFMLIGVLDKQTGETSYIAGGFPSASGKTNLAMMEPPPALAGRYEVHFLGDDIAWLYVDPADGRLYAMNPEFGVFGVAKDTNERSNPHGMTAIGPGSGALFTNTAYNERLKAVWWEGLTPESPPDVTGWQDWRGDPIAKRPARNGDWAHPNSRFTTTLAKIPNLSPESESPKGVPIDVIIFGGRVREREPLVRALPSVPDGVYDGFTLGAEGTAAAEGKEGVLRYDPMSMRPFLSYAEGSYARHWLDLIGRASKKPVFAHVNWFQRDGSGRYLWPGYSENLRALIWLLDLAKGRATGRETAIGLLPAKASLNLEGITLPDEDLGQLLSYDPGRWWDEVKSRYDYLSQFPGLPAEIWDAHERLALAVAGDFWQPQFPVLARAFTDEQLDLADPSRGAERKRLAVSLDAFEAGPDLGLRVAQYFVQGARRRGAGAIVDAAARSALQLVLLDHTGASATSTEAEAFFARLKRATGGAVDLAGRFAPALRGNEELGTGGEFAAVIASKKAAAAVHSAGPGNPPWAAVLEPLGGGKIASAGAAFDAVLALLAGGAAPGGGGRKVAVEGPDADPELGGTLAAYREAMSAVGQRTRRFL